MEDSIISFFINSLKVHIESSLNKFKDIPNLIFNKDFDNTFLNPIFINNINLFKGIINKNNLNYKIFWDHIGKFMNFSIEPLVQKFEEDIKEKKNLVNNNNDEENLVEIGEINLLKLKILNLSLNLIIFNEEDNENKNEVKKLLEIYIGKEIKKKKDFSLFIKNYLIVITLLINNNKEINLSFLRYLSILFYNFESNFDKNEIIKHINIYINQSINNPKCALNIYLNGAFDKKFYKNEQNEKINRSRGTSFDNRENNINNTEKKNKKINDYFKKVSKKGKENIDEENILNEKNNIFNSNCLKENNLNTILTHNNKIINKEEDKDKIKYFISNESNKSLFNLGSNISKHSNSIFLSNSISFFKYNNNGNNNFNNDDNLNISKIFSTPLSELDNKENKENKKLHFRFPSFIKCFKTKKKKPLDKLKNILFNSQMNIKKYIKVENKNIKENESIKELRKIINYDFYGKEINDNQNILNNINKNCESGEKENIVINIDNKEENEDGLLMAKTPNKDDYDNYESKQMNFKENINKIKKSWKILFSQNINFNP